MAAFSAESAAGAQEAGDPGRATALFEHALNFQINAINLAIEEEATASELLPLYRQAVIYAAACGRRQKAQHLLRDAFTLDPDPEQRAALESLEAQLLSATTDARTRRGSIRRSTGRGWWSDE